MLCKSSLPGEQGAQQLSIVRVLIKNDSHVFLVKVGDFVATVDCVLHAGTLVITTE